MLRIKRLSSGFYHIRGIGPYNWAQPSHWPCDDAELERSCFREAGESFRFQLRKARDEAAEGEHHAD